MTGDYQIIIKFKKFIKHKIASSQLRMRRK